MSNQSNGGPHESQEGWANSNPLNENESESTKHELGFVLFLLARATQRSSLQLLGADSALTAQLRRFLGADVAVTNSEQADAPNADMIVDLRHEPDVAWAAPVAESLLWVGQGMASVQPWQCAVDAAPIIRCVPVAQPPLTLVGAGSRAPRFAESPREALLAALLHAAQPTTVVLGPDVVFDGAAKPLVSKISFSGTGGQIGAGDWLITHPDALDRFSPLPGAVALVLGPLTQPLRAAHATLTLGGEASEQLTLIVTDAVYHPEKM